MNSAQKIAFSPLSPKIIYTELKPTPPRNKPGLPSRNSQQSPGWIPQAIENAPEMTDIKLRDSLYRPTGQIVVQVIDGKTGQVIREIPSNELLAIVQSMKALDGLFFNKKI